MNLNNRAQSGLQTVTTRIVWDIETYSVLEHDWHFYDGPWEMVKGGNSKAEMASADQQRTMQNQIAQQQLQLQQQQLSGVNAVLDPMIANGGLAPGVENAMTSLVMNNIPAQFRGIQGGINNALVARGISGGQTGAGSGDVARQFGELGSMQAALQQQGLSNIQLQKQSALLGDLGLKLGIGSQFGQNVGSFNTGASNALNSGVTAANNADQAQTGFFGSLVGGLAGLGGQAISTYGKGCWIARAVFGEESMIAELIRFRLWQRAEKEWLFKVIMTVYMAVGRQVAWMVRRSPWLKARFKKIFMWFLRKDFGEKVVGHRSA
jgi:hypothetical protein